MAIAGKFCSTSSCDSAMHLWTDLTKMITLAGQWTHSITQAGSVNTVGASPTCTFTRPTKNDDVVAVLTVWRIARKNSGNVHCHLFCSTDLNHVRSALQRHQLHAWNTSHWNLALQWGSNSIRATKVCIIFPGPQTFYRGYHYTCIFTSGNDCKDHIVEYGTLNGPKLSIKSRTTFRAIHIAHN